MADLSNKDFREAMARVCAAVNIITTDGPAGRGGLTATAMCSVSDEPPTLLVCMRQSSAQSHLFTENRRFCVNVLAGDQRELAGHFAGGLQDMNARYAAADWTTLATGAPVLSGAVASFDCELAEVHVAATHNILIGRVMALACCLSADALAYCDRAYVDIAAGVRAAA